jgi:hypothetical protein
MVPRLIDVLSVARLAMIGAILESMWKTFISLEHFRILANTARKLSLPVIT